MSRTTTSIERIYIKLQEISGLDGIVAERIEMLEKIVNLFVDDINKNHENANNFDFYGESKSPSENK